MDRSEALGMATAPLEWSLPGTGVDPYGDSLPIPVVTDGLSQPSQSEPGFGPTMQTTWIAGQDVTDPDGTVEW